MTAWTSRWWPSSRSPMGTAPSATFGRVPLIGTIGKVHSRASRSTSSSTRMGSRGGSPSASNPLLSLDDPIHLVYGTDTRARLVGLPGVQRPVAARRPARAFRDRTERRRASPSTPYGRPVTRTTRPTASGNGWPTRGSAFPRSSATSRALPLDPPLARRSSTRGFEPRSPRWQRPSCSSTAAARPARREMVGETKRRWRHTLRRSGATGSPGSPAGCTHAGLPPVDGTAASSRSTAMTSGNASSSTRAAAGVVRSLRARRGPDDGHAPQAGGDQVGGARRRAAGEFGFDPSRQLGYVDSGIGVQRSGPERRGAQARLERPAARSHPALRPAVPLPARPARPPRIIEEFLTDVAYYLELPQMQRRSCRIVQDALRAALPDGGEVVVGWPQPRQHRRLRPADPAARGGYQVRLLVTAGSPLGFPVVQKNLLGHLARPTGRRPRPRSRRRAAGWVNAYDEHDFVALIRPLAGAFEVSVCGSAPRRAHPEPGVEPPLHRRLPLGPRRGGPDWPGARRLSPPSRRAARLWRRGDPQAGLGRHPDRPGRAGRGVPAGRARAAAGPSGALVEATTSGRPAAPGRPRAAAPGLRAGSPRVILWPEVQPRHAGAGERCRSRHGVGPPA